LLDTGTFSPSRLRDLRRACGFSRTELAYEIGRSHQSVENYERGSTVPPPAVVARIAGVLRVPAEALYERDES
jgi:transcriptional regulator with XRE-family HTH domain